MWPKPRPTSVPSGILIHTAIWPQQTWTKNWGAVSLFWGGGGAGSPSNTMSHGLRPTSVPSSILIHPAVWPQRTWAKNWGLCLFWGSWVPILHLTQYGQGRGLSPCQGSFWSIQPFGHNNPTSQTDTTDRQDNGPIAYRMGNHFTNGRPKTDNLLTSKDKIWKWHF